MDVAGAVGGLGRAQMEPCTARKRGRVVWRAALCDTGPRRCCVVRSVGTANPGRYWSDRWDEFGERGGDAERRRSVVSEFVVAASKVLDESVPGDDHLRGTFGPQATHRPEPVFQSAVVGLDRVIREPLDVMPGRRDQLVEHHRVDRGCVGDHFGRNYLQRRQGSGEEPFISASRSARLGTTARCQRTNSLTSTRRVANGSRSDWTSTRSAAEDLWPWARGDRHSRQPLGPTRATVGARTRIKLHSRVDRVDRARGQADGYRRWTGRTPSSTNIETRAGRVVEVRHRRRPLVVWHRSGRRTLHRPIRLDRPA